MLAAFIFQPSPFGLSPQPFAIYDTQHLSLFRVAVFDMSVISALTAVSVHDVSIRLCLMERVFASSGLALIQKANRVEVDVFNVLGCFFSYGLALQNVASDVSIVNATLLYNDGIGLYFSNCTSVVELIECSFLANTASIAGVSINAVNVLQLNVIDGIFLYNQAPKYAACRSCAQVMC